MSLANEEAMMLIIPAARAAVSKTLKNEKGMKQTDIAKLLGTTQAAISKYLSGNYSAKIRRMESLLLKDSTVEELVTMINGGANARKVSAALDRLAYNKALIAAALKICGHKRV